MTYSNLEQKEMFELLQNLAEDYRFPELDTYTGCCAYCGIDLTHENDLQEFDYKAHFPDCKWKITAQQIEKYAISKPGAKQTELEKTAFKKGLGFSWWVAPDTGRRLVLAQRDARYTEYPEKNQYGLLLPENTVHGKFTKQECQESHKKGLKYRRLREAMIIEDGGSRLLIETGEFRKPKEGEFYRIGKKGFAIYDSNTTLDQRTNRDAPEFFDHFILEPFEYSLEYQSVTL
jgi:hypothetical protein